MRNDSRPGRAADQSVRPWVSERGVRSLGGLTSPVNTISLIPEQVESMSLTPIPTDEKSSSYSAWSDLACKHMTQVSSSCELGRFGSYVSYTELSPSASMTTRSC
jgi:hypothetical protein